MANILEDVQHYVVGKLSADWQLSGCCQFLAVWIIIWLLVVKT